MGKQDHLQNIFLFTNISAPDLTVLLSCLHSHERFYKKNTIISLEGDNTKHIGIILSGSVRMLKTDIWGNQTFLTYLEAQDIFGETAALMNEPHSYITFMAVKDTQVLFLPADRIIHTCPNTCPFHTQITQNLFDLLGRKNQRLMEKIEIISQKSIREKIMAYLSLQVERQQSRYISSPLGRTELAEFLGVNRSALTRELSAMREDGLIDFEKNTFTIKRTLTIS